MTYSQFHELIIDNWGLAQETVRDNAIEAILRDPQCQTVDVNSLERIVRIIQNAR